MRFFNEIIAYRPTLYTIMPPLIYTPVKQQYTNFYDIKNSFCYYCSCGYVYLLSHCILYELFFCLPSNVGSLIIDSAPLAVKQETPHLVRCILMLTLSTIQAPTSYAHAIDHKSFKSPHIFLSSLWFVHIKSFSETIEELIIVRVFSTKDFQGLPVSSMVLGYSMGLSFGYA